MRSFIRFNGQEISVEGTIPANPQFEGIICEALREAYGNLVFAIDMTQNFMHPDQTENIFMGVVSGQYEGEAPVTITAANEEGPLFTVPGFLGFRK